MKAVLAVMLMVLGSGVARADVIFDFRLVGGIGEMNVPYLTYAELDAVDLGSVPANNGAVEEYGVVKITGETGGVPITGLGPVVQTDDNKLFLTTGEITGIGTVGPDYVTIGTDLTWTLANGYTLYVENVNPAPELVSDPYSPVYSSQVSYYIPAPEVVPVATPEPGTMGLVGTGVLGVVGMVRRRVRG